MKFSIIFVFIFLPFLLSGNTESNFYHLLKSENSLADDQEYDFEKSVEVHSAYLVSAEQEEDTLRQILGHIFLYSDFVKQSNYEDASKSILQAETLSSTLGNEDYIGWVNHKKASLYVSLREFEKAIEYYEKSLLHCKNAGDTLCIALNYEQLSSMNGQIKNFDLAAYYFDLAEPLLASHADESALLVSLINNGNLLFYQKKYERALANFIRASELGTQLGDKYVMAQLKNNMAQLYANLHNFTKAAELYNECILLNKQNHWPERLVYNYYGLFHLYKQADEHEESLKYYQMYDKLQDSIRSADLQLEIANLETKFELANKELQLQKSNLKLKTAKLLFQRQAFVLILFVLILLGLVYYWFVSAKTSKIRFIESKTQLNSLTAILTQKNGQIGNLNRELNILKNQYDKGKTESVEELNIYNQSILTNSDWLEFKASFEVSYPKYIKKVLHNFASMTEAELRLFLFIKMHLSTKDISAILGISPDSVKKTRHRLRKRINLNEQQSLEEFVGNF